MKKAFLILTILLAAMSTASAASQLTAEPTTVPQGGQATLTIDFNFDKADFYTAYNLTLTFPDGITPVTDSDNNLVVTPGSSHDASHLISSNYDSETNSWIVTCLTFSGKTFKGTTGPLFSIGLHADAELTVGEVLQASITGIALSDTENAAHKLSDTLLDLIVGSPVDTRIVLDEASTTMPEASLNADVRVLRTIKGGEWNTIVLPFAMSADVLKQTFGNGVQVADFLGYDTVEENNEVVGINVQFGTVTSMEANHPYIIKTADDITEFTVNGVDLDPEAEPAVNRGTSKRNYKDFVGTYVANTEVPEEALFISGNQFWYSTGKTKMKGYRAYFEFVDVIESGSSSRISLVLDDAAATGIVLVGKTAADGHYYNLQGQRMSKPAKGIFIKGNKKVVRN